MPFVILIIVSLMGEPNKIELKEADIYNMGGKSIYKIGSSFLTCSTIESTLVLFNSNKIERIYKKRGKGPGELTSPLILGIKDNQIYIYSNYNSIIVLDAALNPVDKKFKVLDRTLDVPDMTSVFISKNEIMTANLGMKAVLHKTTINQNGSVTTESFFKKNELFGHCSGTISNHQIFITRNYFPNDSYHIMVFNINPDFSKTMESQIQMELVRDISSFPQDSLKMPDGSNRLGRAYIIAMVKLNKGYLVELERCRVPGKDGDFIRYRDFFDDTGKFLKREQVKENRYLVPVVNSYDLFVFDEDEEVLIPFKL